jgi:carbon monoxide dehydrogenase subunit G
MATVTRIFNVSPPPELVVDYLKDFVHAEQWDAGTRSCERIDRGPVAEGAFWHNVSKIGGVTAELTYTLEELTERRVVFVGGNQSSTSIGSITVDPAEAGSRITYEAELAMHGTAKLLSPLINFAFERLAADTEKQMTAALNQLAPDGGARR